MRPWSVFRIKPHPTKWMHDASIDWPYLADDPRYRTEDRAEAERVVARDVRYGIVRRASLKDRIPPSIGIISAQQVLQHHGWPDDPPFWVGVPRANWSFRPLGSMARIVASSMFAHQPGAQRWTMHEMMFSPKLVRFCRIGRLDFWIQPEVYEATGELVMGEPWQMSGTAPSITLNELHGERDRQRVVVALDAFIERGEPLKEFMRDDD